MLLYGQWPMNNESYLPMTPNRQNQNIKILMTCDKWPMTCESWPVPCNLDSLLILVSYFSWRMLDYDQLPNSNDSWPLICYNFYMSLWLSYICFDVFPTMTLKRTNEYLQMLMSCDKWPMTCDWWPMTCKLDSMNILVSYLSWSMVDYDQLLMTRNE